MSDEFVALVPLYVDLGKGRLGMVARLPFKGTMEHQVDFELELPKKPREIRVNVLHDVLARD